MRELAERAASVNGAFADQYGVHLVVDGPLPAVRVLADADRIVQVLTNLISNACKFSPRGGRIRVSVGIESSHAIITIRDDGVGIGCQASSITDAASDRRIGLLGMQERAASVGGHVEVKPRREGGTTLRAELPYAGAEPASASASEARVGAEDEARSEGGVHAENAGADR